MRDEWDDVDVDDDVAARWKVVVSDMDVDDDDDVLRGVFMIMFIDVY